MSMQLPHWFLREPKTASKCIFYKVIFNFKIPNNHLATVPVIYNINPSAYHFCAIHAFFIPNIVPDNSKPV